MGYQDEKLYILRSEKSDFAECYTVQGIRDRGFNQHARNKSQMSNIPTVSLNLTNNIPSTSTKTFPRCLPHNSYPHTSNSGGCGLPDLYEIAEGIGSIVSVSVSK